jgi:hypothetical protein
MTPRDLIGQLYVVRIECDKCDRRGRYSLASVVEQIGIDGKLTDWLQQLTWDCLSKRLPGLSDPCGVRMPDLLTFSAPSGGCFTHARGEEK